MDFTSLEKQAAIVLVCQLSTTDSTVSESEIDFLEQVCDALSVTERERDEAVYMDASQAMEVASGMDLEKRQLLYNTLAAQIGVDGDLDSEEFERLETIRSILDVE